MELNSSANRDCTGKFCWEEIEGIAVPFIIRSPDEILAEIGMLKKTLFNKHLQVLDDWAFDMACPSDKKRPASYQETLLLNEINVKHCDYYFSNTLYSQKTFLLGKADISRLYQVLEGVYKAVTTGRFDDPRYGYICIEGSSIPVPFADAESVGMVVPFFFFECPAVMGYQFPLEDHWSLAYLKLFCKLLRVLNTFYDQPTLMVVKFDNLKDIVPEVTRFTFLRNWEPKAQIGPLTNFKLPVFRRPKYRRIAPKSQAEETITIEIEDDDDLSDNTVKKHDKQQQVGGCKMVATQTKKSKKKSNTISTKTTPINEPRESDPGPMLIAPSPTQPVATIESEAVNTSYIVASPASQPLTSLPGGFILQPPTAILGTSLLQPDISLTVPGSYNSAPSYVMDPQTGMLTSYIIPSELLAQSVGLQPVQGTEIQPQEASNSALVLQNQEEIENEEQYIANCNSSQTPTFILPKTLKKVLNTDKAEQRYIITKIPELSTCGNRLSFRVETKRIFGVSHQFVCISKSPSKNSAMLIDVFEIRNKLFPKVNKKLFMSTVFEMKLEMFSLNSIQEKVLEKYCALKKMPNVKKSLYFILEEFRELYWMLVRVFKMIIIEF